MIRVLFILVLIGCVFVGTNVSAQKNDANLSLLKTNSIIFGQVVSCFMRFKIYSQLSSNDEISEDHISSFLTNHVGDIDDQIEKLMGMGRESGFLDEGVFSEKDFKNMVDVLARDEFKSGASWLQALGCYKLIIDFNLVE